MIVDIEQELYTLLKTNIEYKITDMYPTSITSTPIIVISEYTNNTNLETIDSAGEQTNIVYITLELFCSGNKAKSIIGDMTNKIDTLLTGLNFTRVSNQYVTNFADRNVVRKVLRYTFIVDKNKKVYRG